MLEFIGMKRKRCGTCTGCKHIHDCGMCIFCKDKPKYGGPGKRKQCCELRKCIQISNKCQVNATPKLEEIIQPSLQSNSSPVTISTISTYLMHSGRKMHPIVGDGNCLFRAISYALLRTEDHHRIVRTNVVQLMNLNKSMFSAFLIPTVNSPTIDEQVEHRMLPSVWGTHVELIAAATLFQLPIYFCTHSATNTFSWNVAKPLAHENISFPVIINEEFQQIDRTINHIEVYYHDNCHYDTIVTIDSDITPDTVPELTGREYSDVTDLS